MEFLNSWYKRPVTVIAVLLILISFSIVSVLNVKLGPSGSSRKASFVIIIQHFGVNCREIERNITIPIEESLEIIPGIEDIRSTSEYGKSRVSITLNRNASRDEAYLQIRDAVNRVYNTLPPSVQKPQIISSSLTKRPVFIMSVNSSTLNKSELKDYVEKFVKPSFKKIHGTGEIETGGGESAEIHILLDTSKASMAGLTFQDIAAAVQKHNILCSCGKLKTTTENIPLILNGRLNTLNEIRNLQIPLHDGSIKRISDVASVNRAYRENETISRIDGEKRIVLYIQSSGTANLISLSGSLRKESANWNKKGLDTDIIYDKGKKIEESVNNVLKALIAGIIGVIVFLFLFSGNKNRVFLLAATLPLAVLITTALLSLLNTSLDYFILSGMAVGIGLIVDIGIIMSENIISNMNSGNSKTSAVLEILPAVISSTATTLIVLMPLFFLDYITPGIKQAAVSITLLLVFTLFINIFFIPPFLKNERPPAKQAGFFCNKPKQQKRSANKRNRMRLFYKIIFYVLDKKYTFLFSGLLLSVLLVTGILLSGKDFSKDIDVHNLFVHIEFESGASIDSIDARLNSLNNILKGIKGINRIETISRRGNGEMMISFDPAVIEKSSLVKKIKECEQLIPDCFIYIPEKGVKGERKIEISLTGSDNSLLQETARYTAGILRNEEWITEAVMHFKAPPPLWVFTVDHSLYPLTNLNTVQIADTLRWALHGPVAVKWMEQSSETDIRIMQQAGKGIKALQTLPVKNIKGEFHRLEHLGSFNLSEDISKIFHKNRERAVFLTVHTKGFTIDKIEEKLWELLNRINLPEGYGFEIDKQIASLNKNYRILYLVLALSVLLIYMIIAAETESFFAPVLIVSVIPVSMSFPVIALWLKGDPITIPIIIGLIVISGIIVNNSILIIDCIIKRNKDEVNSNQINNINYTLIISIRKRLKPLFLTSGTTILGTLPLAFIQKSDPSFTASLSFVVFWGILGSFYAAFLFLPAVVSAFPGLLKQSLK